MSRLPIFFLLAACGPSTTATLGNEQSSSDLNETVEDTDTTGDVDTIDDTEEEEEEPEFAYSGDYEGEMGILAMSDWGDYEVGTCDLLATVDDVGELLGTADCALSLGWGDPQEYDFDLSGVVTDDGDVSGEMPIEIEGNSDYTMVFVGTADESGMDLDFSVTFEQGGSFELVGDAALERE